MIEKVKVNCSWGHLPLALGMMFTLSCGCLSASAAPLLMEGKSTLYQRVLTTPECVLKASAQDQDGSLVPAFTRYYVYARNPDGTLQVGPDATGNIAGFIDSSCAIDWKMQLALLFTNPADRRRALIFKDQAQLASIIESDDAAAAAAPLYEALEKNGSAPGVVAQEPAEFVDYRKNFYLLPILDSEENWFSDDANVLQLKIASVSAQAGQLAGNAASSTAGAAAGTNSALPLGSQGVGATLPASSASAITAFKAAVVFVIDSSISMQPYIDRTKSSVAAIYKRLEQAGLADSVSFGLVSFRADTRKVPGLEYTSRLFVSPGEAKNGAEFAAKVKDLNQATVSSARFDEDAYAGINTALSKINWQQFGGRYIVLITDAGAIEGSSEQSSTGLDAAQLRLEAEHQGAALYTLHLLTNAGKNNHAKAAAQYQDLSFNSVLQKPLYYPVNAGDVKSFGERIDELAASITEQVRLSAEGKLAAGSATAAPVKADDSLSADTLKLGLAMQLRYLGEIKGTKAPSVFEGYLADKDFASHVKPVCQPVVLLTKAQLSDLKDVVSGVMDAAVQGMVSADDMFSQIKSLAASLGRDPAQLAQKQSFSIGQRGLLGEYLDDLPYKSSIASISDDYWDAMGPQEQDAQIRALESKLKYYEQMNADLDRWVSLSEGADPSESVYPVPLEALP